MTDQRKLDMVWYEGLVDEIYPWARKGLAVEISFEGEVLWKHAVTQKVDLYKRTECLKAIFYRLIDDNVFDDLDLLPLVNMPDSRWDIPF